MFASLIHMKMVQRKIITKSQEQYTESIIKTVIEPVIALDQDLRVVAANPSFYKVFKVKPDETIGQLIYNLGNKQWDIPKLRKLLESILPKKTSFTKFEIEHDFSLIGKRTMLLNAKQIQRVFEEDQIILLAIEDITELKRLQEENKLAEKRLNESELKYRTLFENAGNAIVLISNNTILDCNIMTLKMFDATREQIIGQSPFRFMPQNQPDGRDSQEKTAEKIKTALNGDAQFFEWQHTKLDGTLFDAEVSLSCVKVKGQIFVQAIIRDISDRKKLEAERSTAEKRLRESQYLLRLVLDTIPVRIFWKDINLNYLGCNQSFVLDAGFKSPKEIIGHSDFDMHWTKDQTNSYRDDDLAVIASGRPKLNYVESTTVNNSLIWVRSSKVLLRDGKGKIKGILGIYENITSQKGIESEKEKAVENLQESQYLLHLVLDTIPVRIFWKDINLNYLGCNQAFALDSGFKAPEEIIGRSDFEMGWKDQADSYRADDQAVISSGIPKLRYEEPQTTPEGGLIWLRSSKIPLRDTQGKIKGILGTYEDITEHKETENKLKKAYDELKELTVELKHSLQIKSDFMAQMSHELITPLNSINGFSEVLYDETFGPLNEKQKKYTSNVLTSGKHLLKLINQILDMSKVKQVNKAEVI